jgi:acyl-coenzyme A thioesterase PaaI-like protein
MEQSADTLARLRATNAAAAFNRWCGIEVLDTACGFAAVTVVGRVMASHYAVNCLRPAVGERFIARAKVVKPGKNQVFTSCELVAESGGSETLVATGETLLVVAPEDAGA